VVEAITDGPALAAGLGLLAGRRDVASFTVPDAARGSTERTLYRVALSRRRWGIEFHFLGDGFLRYQVRRMVGALLEVGRGTMTFEQFQQLLSRPRPGASIRTAPANGLSLERVLYRRCPALDPDASGTKSWPSPVW
jgi:tRNA pseudouridine38-40 synthase